MAALHWTRSRPRRGTIGLVRPTGACPACGSTRVARILYGLPAYDDELRRELDEGRVVLGGCCIDEDMPTRECLECGHSWADSTPGPRSAT
jgi:hypothetical protein